MIDSVYVKFGVLKEPLFCTMNTVSVLDEGLLFHVLQQVVELVDKFVTKTPEARIKKNYRNMSLT